MSGLIVRMVSFVLLILVNATVVAWVVDDVPVLTDVTFGQMFSTMLAIWITWSLIDTYKLIEEETRD